MAASYSEVATGDYSLDSARALRRIALRRSMMTRTMAFMLLLAVVIIIASALIGSTLE